MECSRGLVVLTGAGCSTDSGIPDYRDLHGGWKRRQPIQYREFVGDARARQRYWARSLIGWERVARAEPNPAHQALARLEAAARVRCVITQNVDGLHQRAGSRAVIDLHGRVDRVCCLGCGAQRSRESLQDELQHLNPGWRQSTAYTAPDGDVDLVDVDYESFRVPACERCRGVLKPDVVFFGENVPRGRVGQAMRALEEADALLVVGSSLMVWSGYRFVRLASERGLPMAAVNLGRTRADAEIALKITRPCGEALPAALARLGL